MTVYPDDEDGAVLAELRAQGVASLTPDSPFLLPANTKLEALNKCIVSFPGTDLFEPGDVIGEVVVIDDDALMHLAPNNEDISLHLERGHSMSIVARPSKAHAIRQRWRVSASERLGGVGSNGFEYNPGFDMQVTQGVYYRKKSGFPKRICG